MNKHEAIVINTTNTDTNYPKLKSWQTEALADLYEEYVSELCELFGFSLEEV